MPPVVVVAHPREVLRVHLYFPCFDLDVPGWVCVVYEWVTALALHSSYRLVLATSLEAKVDAAVETLPTV